MTLLVLYFYKVIFYLQIYILFMDKPLLHPLWIYSHNELSTLTKEQNK